MLDSPQFTPPALTHKEMKDQEVALSDKKKPYVFSLKGQLLEQGRTDSVLAATDDLTIRLKIYASGGENELHAHPHEDHSFMILQGSARFFGPEDEAIETCIQANSQDASLVFLGLPVPQAGEEALYAETLVKLVNGMPDTLLVRNAGPFRGRLV